MLEKVTDVTVLAPLPSGLLTICLLPFSGQFPLRWALGHTSAERESRACPRLLGAHSSTEQLRMPKGCISS